MLQTARKTGSSDVTKSGISGFYVRQGCLRSTNTQSAGIIFQSPTWIFAIGKDLVLVRIHSKMLRKESTTWKNISNFTTFNKLLAIIFCILCSITYVQSMSNTEKNKFRHDRVSLVPCYYLNIVLYCNDLKQPVTS